MRRAGEVNVIQPRQEACEPVGDISIAHFKVRIMCSCMKREGGVGSCAGEPPLSLCHFNEILRSLYTFIPQDQQGGPSIRESALWYEGEFRHSAWRANELVLVHLT
jgi:hypothetical protein